MIMESKRLFVGNLPPGVTENDLTSEFNAYGNVQKVELKFKENLVDPTNPSFFAFIVIEADARQINQCIDEFKREQYRGKYLTVSLARESFLDRLKREREEAGIKKLTKEDNSYNAKTDESKLVKKLPTLKKVTEDSESSSSSSSSESESSSSNESESNQITESMKKSQKIEEPEEFLTKKRASNSMQNGKIKIQTNLPRDPIHIIHKKEKIIQNNLDDKGKMADKKRKESMHKMKDQYTKQKLAIQQSLASVDSNKSRKICFDDGDEITKPDQENSKISSAKMDLFNDDEEEEDSNNFQDDFAIKDQFQGEKGQKLMKLQSKFQLDSRFKMDKKFMEVDEEYDNNEDISKSIKKDLQVDDNEDDERKWQLGIIEQVIGHKFDSLSEVNRKKIRKTMLRYDPTKQEHEKFLKNIEKVTKNITPVVNTENNEIVDTTEVSKEQFFKINDDLTNSLKRRGDGFSLLSMFGRPEEKDNDNFKDNDEKVLISSKPNNQSNPFKYDSSDSEDEPNPEITDKKLIKSIVETNQNQVSKGGKLTKTGIWTENFFISNEDPRLIDGAEFFKAIKRNNDETKEDYANIKKVLKRSLCAWNY